MTAQDEAAVLAADDARRAATMRGDVAALEAIYTDDFTYIHSSGFREGKRDYLDRMSVSGVRYPVMERLAAQVRVLGDTALVDGTSSLQFQKRGDPEPKPLDSIYLAVWVRHGDAWRMAAYASTACDLSKA